jgi:hypothetical protein
MALRTETYIGRGSLYLEEIGGTTGLLPVGNAPELSFGFEEDKKNLKDYEGDGGADIDTVSIVSAVTGSATLNSFSAANLAKLLRGSTTIEASGTAVTSETHTAYEDALVAFDKFFDKTIGVTVTDVGATTTFVEGTDYTVKNSGVTITSAADGGTIPDGSTIEVNYTTIESTNVEALTVSGKEYRLVFDGLNSANQGAPIRVVAHRVKLDPVSTMALINEDFAGQEVSFSVIKDETVTGGSDKSKFFIVTK